MSHPLFTRHEEVTLRDMDLGNAIEAMPDGVAIHDGHCVRYVNPALASALAFQREQIVGHPISEFVHPQEREEAQRRIERILAGHGSPAPSEHRCLRGDGGIAQIEVWGVLVKYRGEPAVMLVLKDLDNARYRHKQLLLSDRLASLGLLAAGIGHEIKNPLTYLQLVLAQLERTLDTARQPGDSAADPITLLSRAEHAAARIGQIVASLGSYAGSATSPPMPVEVTTVVESALRMVAHRIRRRGQIVRHFEECPPVLANEVLLVQVLVNLLVNASDALPEGEAVDHAIEVRLRPVGDQVSIEVIDDGSGMTPDKLDRVFDLFFTTKPPGSGTGLGLPLSRDIVDSLGGKLTLHSEPGAGTTAQVLLPIAPRSEPGAA